MTHPRDPKNQVIEGLGPTSAHIKGDVRHLMKLRLVVARLGEMDQSRWWNTKGMLANVGALALSRGFSKSHVFARARAVFAVAASRSAEVFDPPDSMTLWCLPVDIEDQLDDAWATWLEDPDPWVLFLHSIEEKLNGNLLGALKDLDLITDNVIDRANRLRRADDLRSVPIKLNGETLSEAISLLASAHCCSEPGKLAVPFVRREELLP